MIKRSILQSSVKFALPILLAVGFIWWLYRDIDLETLRHQFHSMHYPALALSLVFGLIANVIRGLRWHLLVTPLAHEAGGSSNVSNAIATVLGSYSVNMLIPRGGELWRCIAFRKYERLSLSAIIGTLITDRMADILCLGGILLVVISLYPDFFLTHLFYITDYSTLFQELLSSWWVYALIALGLSLVGLCVYFYRTKPQHRLSQSIIGIGRGIGSVRRIGYPIRFSLYSLLIWLGYFGFFYTTFFAFDFTKNLPLSAGLIAFAMSSLSVLAPTQNGIGAWHFMVITTLVAYGVEEHSAKSFALIVHTTQTLWITLVGLVAIILLPIINRHYIAKRNTQ